MNKLQKAKNEIDDVKLKISIVEQKIRDDKYRKTPLGLIK
jgi:hypothetical protein